MRRKRQALAVGLDLGTTKTCAVVTDAGQEGVEVVGVGSAPTTGLRKGAVVNLDATARAIRAAVEEAELMADCEIHRVVASVGGTHVAGLNSYGIAAVKGEEVESQDVERVMDAARAVALPVDREILHVLPQEFIVNGQEGIVEPVGMTAVRLEARAHLITAARDRIRNVVKCCHRAGVEVAEVVASGIAVAEAVLSEEERELGVGLVDLGGGTADVLLYQAGALRHTAVIPLGGVHVTNDIAVGLRVPQHEAERIKCRHGSALAERVPPEETIEVSGIGGRTAQSRSRRVLAEIVEPRVEEIFKLVLREIVRSGHEGMLGSGVVVTGGGALLEGTAEVGERVLGLPVRVGRPGNAGGIGEVVEGPAYAAAVGLVLYAARRATAGRVWDGGASTFGRVRFRMTEWLREFF